MISTEDARSSIEDVQAVRRELADRADCSPTWRVTVAVLSGAMCASQAAPGFIALALAVGCFAAILVMAIVARRRMGFFINVYRQSGGRKVAIGLLVVIETLYLSSIWLKLALHVTWAPIVAGAIIVPTILIAMQRWQDAYRSEFVHVVDDRA